MSANNMENLKVALVHDFLNQYGGAERVLAALAEMFPEAPIYTLLYEPAKMRGKFARADIRPSFLQKFPAFVRRRHKWLLPLMPVAPETFNLRDYDLVISSSSAFAKGIVVKPKTIHVCYCHTPMRYAWDWNEKYLSEQKLGGKRKLMARMLLNYIRVWDRVASDRVDHFIANSKTTAGRIKKYYGRESEVVYPPVEMRDWENLDDKEDEEKEEKYFLIVSRLSAYKKIEIAVKALNKLDLPLVVIGEGDPKYSKYLKSIAGPRTKFLGWLSDTDVQKYFRNCRALILPGEEDFGLTPIEAMAHGKPVIALRKGGATETVIAGVTGEFFDDPASESLAAALRKFLEKKYDREEIRKHAQKFSKETFKENMNKIIKTVLEHPHENKS